MEFAKVKISGIFKLEKRFFFNLENRNLALKIGKFWNCSSIRYSALLAILPIVIFPLWYKSIFISYLSKFGCSTFERSLTLKFETSLWNLNPYAIIVASPDIRVKYLQQNNKKTKKKSTKWRFSKVARFEITHIPVN